PVAAAGLCGLKLIASQPERRQSLLKLASYAREQFLQHRFECGSSSSQILPLILGDAGRAMSAAQRLRDRGFFVPAIRPPSVPEGKSLLRISLTCLHTE